IAQAVIVLDQINPAQRHFLNEVGKLLRGQPHRFGRAEQERTRRHPDPFAQAVSAKARPPKMTEQSVRQQQALEANAWLHAEVAKGHAQQWRQSKGRGLDWVTDVRLKQVLPYRRKMNEPAAHPIRDRLVEQSSKQLLRHFDGLLEANVLS